MADVKADLIGRIVARYAVLPQVRAIALAGSQATEQASQASDYDIYIYVQEALPAALRLKIGQAFSPTAQLVDYWGPGLEWDDPSGVHIDTVYFETTWIDEQIERTMTRHEASLGYSTAFVHTVRVSRILHDPTGWFAGLQSRARQPYPDALARNIVALNLLVLRTSHSSYRQQLQKAAMRGDWVSLNHRTAAFLASVFDILFAINKVPHPGEKRLLNLAEERCAVRPAALRSDITQLLQATTSDFDAVLPAADQIVDSIEIILKHEGWL
jgi:hypothetical protein